MTRHHAVQEDGVCIHWIDHQLGALDDPDRVDANIAQLEAVAATVDHHLSRLRQQSSNARLG